MLPPEDGRRIVRRRSQTHGIKPRQASSGGGEVRMPKGMLNAMLQSLFAREAGR